MEPQKITYYNEISLMMFGFGDSHKPNPETVRFVESIVLRQLRTIVHEALKYCETKFLRGEELVFLMRKNKWKMRRFVKYLHNKDRKLKFEADTTEEVKPTKRHKNELLDFIEKIDETGELTDLTEFDEGKYERQVRADRISLALDEKKYMDFYKARCTSFSSKEMSRAANYEKLRLWVDPKKELNFTNVAIEVLLYYAYETVAQITDYALLVRMDARRNGDPLSNLSGAHYSATMFVAEHKFSGPNPDYSRVYNGQPPISVAEIKEVLRRVNMPQAGKLNFVREGIKEVDKGKPEVSKEGTQVKTIASISMPCIVILQTLLVRIKHGNHETIIRALLEPASQKSYILKSTLKEIGCLPERCESIQHSLFGGHHTEVTQHDAYITITLSSLEGDYIYSFEAIDHHEICGNIAPIPSGPWVEQLKLHNIYLSDVNTDGPIEVLFGADVVGSRADSRPNQAWLETYGKGLKGYEQLITDTLGITDPSKKLSKIEPEAATHQHFLDSVKINEEGLIEVRLPFIENHPHSLLSMA
ncbi:hypothetical protein ILUMI_01872 [Ignelater luminosus]|uniref:Uncharacterized protein n=1 Tax=Ignelater luminosus TaxID=2038154 RepID=A0A8K0DIS9_IGNLU|nr:hypothetical protein ILUMI_01872 [Ignelater luminosus]